MKKKKNYYKTSPYFVDGQQLNQFDVDELIEAMRAAEIDEAECLARKPTLYVAGEIEYSKCQEEPRQNYNNRTFDISKLGQLPKHYKRIF